MRTTYVGHEAARVLTLKENLPSFRGDSSARSWLLGIARHRVEDYYRSRLRDPLPQDGDTEDLADLAAEFSLEEALDREQLCRRTKEVLEGLPETYSIALLWRYWEKRSAREMAEETGRSEKAIERVLARARSLFKKRWNCDRSNW